MTGIPGERCCRIILVAGFDGRCGMMVDDGGMVVERGCSPAEAKGKEGISAVLQQYSTHSL
jgi:hypothetical protein